MTKGKKRPTAALYEHDHEDTTENSVIQISGDFRRRRIRTHPARIEQPVFTLANATNQQEDWDHSSFDLSEFQDSLPEAITDQVEGITVVTKAKAKRYENSVSTSTFLVLLCLILWKDAPLKTFAPYRDKYLDELLFNEGRGMYMDDPICPHCASGQAEIRCKDCLGEALLCRLCAVKQHQWNPLHRVQVSIRTHVIFVV